MGQPALGTHKNTCPGQKQEAVCNVTAHNVALNSCLVKTARHKVTSEGSLSVVALSTELRTLGIKDFHDWQKQKGDSGSERTIDP